MNKSRAGSYSSNMLHLPIGLLLLFLHAAMGLEIEGYACADTQGNSILVSREALYLMEKTWEDYQVKEGSTVTLEAQHEEPRLLTHVAIKTTRCDKTAAQHVTAELTLSGKLSYIGPKCPTIMLHIPAGAGRSICLSMWDMSDASLTDAAKAQKDLTIHAPIRVIIAPLPHPPAEPSTQDPPSLSAIANSDIIQLRGYELIRRARAYIHNSIAR